MVIICTGREKVSLDRGNPMSYDKDIKERKESD